ncbi:MAG: alpha/beta hydrolase [Rhizobium sp.]|nr:alpha/beta hydrolase [Rhizobium sp.]
MNSQNAEAQTATSDLMRDPADNPLSSIVIVHGGFVDGSGWLGVHKILKRDGYEVLVVQNKLESLEGDVAATRQAIAAAKGKVVLVGHSYGGVVISEAGSDPKVERLVYIAAFVPDEGESVASLIANRAHGAPVPPILPPEDGYLFLDKAKFSESFAGDVPSDICEFMADSQVPWGVLALNGAVTIPAWRSKPSWYLVAAQDRMIPPDAQRHMAARAGARLEETMGSHAVYVSKPEVVAAIIISAAQDTQR